MKNCTSDRSMRKFRNYRALALAAGTWAALYGAEASAQSIIKQPGNHPPYSVDLEPHLVLGLDDTPYYGGNGFGLGLRATIPFLRNGPISTINNDMGIGFGLEWLSRGSSCANGYYYYPGRNYAYSDCSAYSFILPVVLQWNFYLTDIITVYGEPGLALRFSHVSWNYPGGALGCPANGYCQDSNTYTDVLPVFAGGAKFMFGRTVGLNVRLGYPYVSVGASILL